MDFVGEFNCKLDEKGRLRLPGDLKKLLSQKADNTFVVIRGFDGCLELYPKDFYDFHLRKYQTVANRNDKNVRVFMRRFQSGAVIQLDTADRLNFPNHLLKEMGMQGVVYLTPGIGTIEMWSEEAHKKNISGIDEGEFSESAHAMPAIDVNEYYQQRDKE